MRNKINEIVRSYERALREGIEIRLTKEGIKYYLEAIKELDEENKKLVCPGHFIFSNNPIVDGELFMLDQEVSF